MLNFGSGTVVCLRNCASLWIMEARWTGQWFINITSPAFSLLHVPSQAMQSGISYPSILMQHTHPRGLTNLLIQENFSSYSWCWHQKYFSTIVVGTVSSFSESQCLALLLWLLFPLLPSITRSFWELEEVLGLGSGQWDLHWHLGHTSNSGVTEQGLDWSPPNATELQEPLQQAAASSPTDTTARISFLANLRNYSYFFCSFALCLLSC